MWPRAWMTGSVAVGGFTSLWGRNCDRSKPHAFAAREGGGACQAAPPQTLVVLATGYCGTGVAAATGAGGHHTAGVADRCRHSLDHRPDSRAADRGRPGLVTGAVAGGTPGVARLWRGSAIAVAGSGLVAELPV